MVTARRRGRRPAGPERPLTPAEQEAVERQGAYLAWARTIHPGIGPGLFTQGVCGGSPRTDSDKDHVTSRAGPQGKVGPASRDAIAASEHREREETERRATQDKTT